MRVLLANSFYYPRGGDCIHVLDLEQALTAQGHDVAVLSMRHPENLDSPWSGYWIDNVEYRGRLSVRAKMMALHRSVYAPDAAAAMRRLVHAFRPDIVHCHSLLHHLTIAPVREAIRIGLPVVWTLHDYRLVCPSTHLLANGQICRACAGGRFIRALPKRCKSDSAARTIAAVLESYMTRASRVLQRVDCFVAPSEFLATTVREMGLPSRRIEVLPNPVRDVGKVAVVRRDREIIYVGRLSAEKGASTFIDSAALQNVTYVLIGDGPDRAQLEREASQRSASITFRGWLQRSETLRAIARATLLAIPSVCYENCPTVALEAMALGTPVVASDLGGLPELVDHGRCGFLVRAGDSGAWRTTLEFAMAHPDERQQLALAAQQRVRERHSWDRFLGRLERIYARAVRQLPGDG